MPHYTYNVPYKKNTPFELPNNIPSDLVPKMMRASKFFREQDRNNNGTLQYRELYNVVNETLGVEMPLKEVRKLFLEIDDNGNGVITEREFCEWYVDYVEES
ncbi:hypothetical protein LY90DRAFT_700430 [Neocallimastix californiae]|uniref:EF-hand domain-containing protein n=1 Tax=Neocallimastix californiae TaxID=1754190 RepID=A0A1Y2E9B6_9FUNG|nr:hypothetical protein LY90DRAFT_700430 [Neocallimastix californiae]|eukprot:ORY67997.1 hypothetical protein LY90DRAFT_700430 [Neocallimastix californiae]